MLLLFLYLFLFFPEAFEVCKRRIIALNGLPGIPQHFTDDERDIHMSSLVPFDSSNMVSLEQVSGLYPWRETAKTFLESLMSSIFTAYLLWILCNLCTPRSSIGQHYRPILDWHVSWYVSWLSVAISVDILADSQSIISADSWSTCWPICRAIKLTESRPTCSLLQISR